MPPGGLLFGPPLLAPPGGDAQGDPLVAAAAATGVAEGALHGSLSAAATINTATSVMYLILFK